MYSNIKFNLNCEKYLNIPNQNVRKAVTNLRLSCHKLPIESGRYINIERNERLCTYCNYEIGDEVHYYMHCFHPTLTKLRNTFLTKIFCINPALKSLNRNILFKYILNLNYQNIIEISVKYIYEIASL